MVDRTNLLDILEDLSKEELDKFRFILSTEEYSFKPIPKSKVEDASCTTILNIMLDRYSEEAVDVILIILQRIKNKRLFQKLSKLKDDGDRTANKTIKNPGALPASSGAGNSVISPIAPSVIERNQMKQDPRQYYQEMTLNPNTANTLLDVSSDKKTVIRLNKEKPYPYHKDRFDESIQVLSLQSLSDHCYWEAEYSGQGAEVAVAYEGIARKGLIDCDFGNNEVSWSLKCSNGSFSVWHNSKETPCNSVFNTRRVGVYFNRDSGSLSFYCISTDTQMLFHLYTFHSKFTDTLYAGFYVNENSSVTLM